MGAVAGVRRRGVWPEQPLHDGSRPAGGVATVADGLWDAGLQLGDWLDPTAPPEQPFKAKADSGVVATACCYRTAWAPSRTPRSCSARPTKRSTSRSSPSGSGPLSSSTTSGERDHAQRLRHGLRVGHLFGLLDRDGRVCCKGRSTELAALSAATDSRPGFAGSRTRRCPHRTGHLERLRLLLERECPSLAVPRHDGGHDDLGAMGPNAARRHHQPGPNHEFQPLRAGCRRGLDPSLHRRDRAAGARIRHGALSHRGRAAA